MKNSQLVRSNCLRCRQLGFTMIESVMVIVFIGILAVFVMARFSSGDTFNSVIIRDQIVSLVRTAQQASLGRTSVSMTITPSAGGDSVTITTSDGGGTIDSVQLDLSNVTLSGDINKTASCAVDDGDFAIASATPMTLNFGELGDLGVSGVTGNTGAISSAVRICVNDSATDSVCVSPSGFAYAGNCDV